LQNYFTKLINDEIKVLIKPQYVDTIPKNIKGTISENLHQKSQQILDDLDLNHLLDRDISVLSGGELQRFAIAKVISEKVEMYIFDEPSSYLDIKQRLKVSNLIRNLISYDNYVICIEHDLSILDYISDYICCLYGVPGSYGVVTAPFSNREGINIFLLGFIPTENLRFREQQLDFKLPNVEAKENNIKFQYPEMEIILGTATRNESQKGTATRNESQKGTATRNEPQSGTFKLKINSGYFCESEITVLLAENGMGRLP
jgi:ATP-binding cassette subfamily E protein 1